MRHLHPTYHVRSIVYRLPDMSYRASTEHGIALTQLLQNRIRRFFDSHYP